MKCTGIISIIVLFLCFVSCSLNPVETAFISETAAITAKNQDIDNSTKELPTNIFYIGEPVYYNRLDYDDDALNPIIGAEYTTDISMESYGHGKTIYSPFLFRNGLTAGCKSKYSNDYAQIEFKPFTLEKPDLSIGTAAFWANAIGGWRGQQVNTHVNSHLYFYITNSTFLRIDGKNKSESNSYYVYINNKNVFHTSLNGQDIKPSIIFQWNFRDGFDDGTKIRFYLNGILIKSFKTDEIIADVRNCNHPIKLKSYVEKRGSTTPKNNPQASLDNVIFWNYIEDPVRIAALNN